MNSGAMTPAKVYLPGNMQEYLSAGRKWQGIPAVEITKQGRMYAAWYSGGATEQPGNVVILEKSDDGGATWTDGFAVVRHDDPNVRCFDEALWIDPRGRLWLTWAQSAGSIYDGRDGVWAAVAENPEADTLEFSEPKRIANGVMMNKPTVTAKGEWVFSCSLWGEDVCRPGEAHPELDDERRANVYVSRDEGETFELRGGVVMPGRCFDEHMTVEKQDGTLWMLSRTNYGIGQAISKDGGYSWENAGPSGHTGPNSRFFISRLQSGRLLLVNHVNPSYTTNTQSWNKRNNLMAMLSEDDGKTWRGGLMLDTRDNVSYPDGAQAEDGRIYIVYDHERYGAREIMLACFTEEDVLDGHLSGGESYLARVINRATGDRE